MWHKFYQLTQKPVKPRDGKRKEREKNSWNYRKKLQTAIKTKPKKVMNEIRKMTQMQIKKSPKCICKKAAAWEKIQFVEWFIQIWQFAFIASVSLWTTALDWERQSARTIGHLHSKTWYISVRYISNGKCSFGLHVVTEFRLIDNVICHRPIAKFIRMTSWRKKSINMRHIHNRKDGKKTKKHWFETNFVESFFPPHFLHDRTNDDENINTYISRQQQQRKETRTEWEKLKHKPIKGEHLLSFVGL